MLSYRIQPFHSQYYLSISNINRIKNINTSIVTYGDLQVWNPGVALHCVVTWDENYEAIKWFTWYIYFFHHMCINEIMCFSSIYQNLSYLSQYHTLASNSVIARDCWKYCHSCFIRWRLILFLFLFFNCCPIFLLLIWNVPFFIHTPFILIIIRKYIYVLRFSFSTFMPRCPWLEACEAQYFSSKFILVPSFLLF